MLEIPGGLVQDVSFTDQGVIVDVRLRKRRLLCPCGNWSNATYDRKIRRWRHLDLGATRCWLQMTIRRVDCRRCGQVRTEQVPWARPGARHTQDFEDIVGWLCQRTDRTTVTTLMRVSWRSVTRIVKRVVDAYVDNDRLENLYRIGVDEICYRRGGRDYLTVVADHDTGRVVHVAEGRTQEALSSFFQDMGPERCAQVEAISMDMAPMWRQPCATYIPQAQVCLDPFHIILWVNQTLDLVFRSKRRQHTDNRQWQRARSSIRTGAENLSTSRRELLEQTTRNDEELGRAWMLKEDLRDIYRIIHPTQAADYLADWIARARSSGIPAFVTLARRINRHTDGILNTINQGISNGRSEGINAKIRLINKRGYGHHSAQTLATMIYLCLGRITIQLPTQ